MVSIFVFRSFVDYEIPSSIHVYMSHSMSLSQETSSGCFTSEEEEQRRILGQTPTSHVTQLLVCLECGCKLEAISQQIMDLQDDNRCLRCQLIKESVSGECKYVLTMYRKSCCINIQACIVGICQA